MATDGADKELEPYSCLTKKKKKYASETEEVYLSSKGGTALSHTFEDFINLSVAWLNNNRLMRLDELTPCFRLKELYIQNNRIVSLACLKSFKFIRVLLASNNQIRNLDKQLELLTRCSFMKKCDLFGNAMAEEPDYRLRMIYHVPQLDVLDQLNVTGQQRTTAEEIVPNMDKVAAAKPVKPVKKAMTLSTVEDDCFRTARAVNRRRRKEADDSLRTQTFSKSMGADADIPLHRGIYANQHIWSSPARYVERELNQPSAYERTELRKCLLAIAGEEALTKEAVVDLACKLATEGVEEVGRQLARPDVFAPPPPAGSSTGGSLPTLTRRLSDPKLVQFSHPLEKLLEDSEATLPAAEVVNYLLTLDWTRHHDDHLDQRIAAHYQTAKLADLQARSSQDEAVRSAHEEVMYKARNAALRLEGVKTRKCEVGLEVKPKEGLARKSRSDLFHQSFLKPCRSIDDITGRTVITVTPVITRSKICDHRI